MKRFKNIFSILISITYLAGIQFFFQVISNEALAKKPQDYQFYSKYGHKSRKWNKYVKEGFSHYEQQNCAGALQALNQAITAQCQDALVYFKMAVCSEITGSQYSAEQYYQTSLSSLKRLKAYHRYKKDIYENYGRLLYTQKRFDEAFKYLKKAGEIGNPSFALYYMLGELYFSKGQRELAVNHYQKALAQNLQAASPAMLGKAHKEIARVFLEEKNFQAALQSISQAKRFLPRDQELKTMSMQANQKIQENKLIHQLEDFNKKHRH